MSKTKAQPSSEREMIYNSNFLKLSQLKRTLVLEDKYMKLEDGGRGACDSGRAIRNVVDRYRS